MAYGYSANKPALQRRLARAEGQVRGVARMVETDSYCIDILTQLAALQAALDNVALELVRDHARHCLRQPADDQAAEDQADELVQTISRLMRR